MAITQSIDITVSGNKASLSSPVFLYLGDGVCTLELSITKLSMSFKRGFSSPAVSVIDEFSAQRARICILTPYMVDSGLEDDPATPKVDESKTNALIIDDECEIVTNDKGVPVVYFVIKKEYIDRLGKEGEYQLQIHLYDSILTDGTANRYTIPPVSLTVLSPLCDRVMHDISDSSIWAIADRAHVDAAVVGATENLGVFDDNGIYRKLDWDTGYIINASDLDRIEAGIWWNSYYGNLVVDKVADLYPTEDSSGILTDYLKEGTKCFVREFNECYYYIGGKWVTVENSFTDLLGRYATDADLNATKTELENKINETKENLQAEIDTTETELSGNLEAFKQKVDETYATKLALNETNNNLAQLNNDLDQHEEYAETTYATKKEIAKEVTEIEYATNLNLTNAKHQYFSLGSEDVVITLPNIEINEIYEIHLYIKVGSDTPNITFTNVSKWQQIIALIPDGIFEFIFTWLPKDQIWLGGFISIFKRM